MDQLRYLFGYFVNGNVAQAHPFAEIVQRDGVLDMFEEEVA